MPSITNLESEVIKLIKQKYGLTTVVHRPNIHETAVPQEVIYESVIVAPSGETSVCMVKVLQSGRGFTMQVFENVHQVFLPR